MPLPVGTDVIVLLGIVAFLALGYLLVIVIANTRMFRPTPREIAFLGIFLLAMGMTAGLLIGGQVMFTAVAASLTVLFAAFLLISRLNGWRQKRREGRAFRSEGYKTAMETYNRRRD